MTDVLLQGTAIRRVYPLPRTSLFGARAVRAPSTRVDVAVPEGASLGIVGESGSGKSTLVRILLGLDRATSGTVTYRGQPIAPGRPRAQRWFRREAQVVLQDPLSSLDPRMTIASVIREPLVCLDMPGDHEPASTRSSSLSARSGVAAPLPARALGRPAAARRRRPAIASRPRLLVGDEPVSALDVSVRVQILDLLRRLADEYDLTLVLVSHDLGVVNYLCDDVLVLRDGVAVEQGPTRRVFSAPDHDYTRGAAGGRAAPAVMTTLDVLVDIDGVLYPFPEVFTPYAADQLGRHLELDTTRWEFYEEWGLDYAGFVELVTQGVGERRLWWEGAPYADVPGAIDRIQRDGHRIHLVTARDISGTRRRWQPPTTGSASHGFVVESVNLAQDKPTRTDRPSARDPCTTWPWMAGRHRVRAWEDAGVLGDGPRPLGDQRGDHPLGPRPRRVRQASSSASPRAAGRLAAHGAGRRRAQRGVDDRPGRRRGQRRR